MGIEELNAELVGDFVSRRFFPSSNLLRPNDGTDGRNVLNTGCLLLEELAHRRRKWDECTGSKP